MHRDRIWVVTPVYLDVEAFLVLRERLLTTLAAGGGGTRFDSVMFAVVDDTAGADPETARLEALGDVRVLTPPFNLGHQGAIVYGLRTLAHEIGERDLVVTLDSDGQDRPEDLPRLLEPLAAAEAEPRTVVLALRTRRREPAAFKVLYVLFRLAFRLLTGLVVRTGNYAAYRGWLARRIIHHPHFNLSYSSALMSLDNRVVLVPCERGTRYTGRTRMGYSRLLRHGLSMFMPFTDRIAVRALVLFSVTLAVSLLLSAIVISVRLFTSQAIPGWATSTLLLLLVLSFVAFGNLVVLFALFSQSRGMALASAAPPDHGSPRDTPPPTA